MKRVSLSSGKFRSASRLFALLVAVCWATPGVCHSHHHGSDNNREIVEESFWDSAFEVDGIYYAFASPQEVFVCRNRQENGELSRYSGVVHIPEEIEYKGDEVFQSGIYRVIGINGNAFTDCSELTEVFIPSSIIYIRDGAFNGCTGLEKIVVEEGNPYYDSRENCNAIIFNISDIWGNSDVVLMVGCMNSSIPNGVTSITSSAFYGCVGLKEVTIPSSVTSIPNNAFYGCTGLERIVVEEGNPNYDSREDCNAIIRTERNELFVGCKNTSIPNSVTSIGNSVFYGCSSLTSVTIPNSVTSIGNSAFENCTNLTELTIGNGVTFIDYDTFRGCTGLKKLTIGSSLNYFGPDLFFESIASLESIVVDKDNPYFDSREDCNAVIFTSTNSLILGCKNTRIPNNVTNIGSYAFYDCTGLTGELVLSNSVTSIGESAFEDCSGLTQLTIGKGVTSIGKCAFTGCSSLDRIVVDDNNRYYDSRENCNAIIHTYGTIVTLVAGCNNSHIPNGVTAIDEHAFYGMAGLTKIHIPNSVTSIDKYAFEGCNNLAEVTIGSNVTSIDYGAFFHCTGLPQIHIPNSVTSIDDYAFDDCGNLAKVTLGNSVASIGWGAFSRCKSLVSITSLNPVPPTIESDTFEGITKETGTLYVPEGCKRTYWTLPYWEEFVNIQDDATDGIGSIIANKHGKIKIYTLDGKQLQTTNVTDLPKNIYIINGKKHVVK